MFFNRKKVRKRTFNARKYLKKKKKNTKIVLKIILFLILSFFIVSTLIGVILYKKYIEPLPPVEEIKNMSIAQTSIIYDKNGKELYKIFKENRTYVDYKDISKNMINAIVAGEDQRFWTTPGFDIIGIFRAVLYGILTGDFKGTSGLSQQLMKVTYLSSEKTLERKVKELYLSRKLNKVYDKTKILELYLNKIFFGSNAYGIEQASKTFFGTNAKYLNVLQSSILASLPKAPSGLSPYSHKDKLLGYLSVKDLNGLNKGDNQEIKLLTTKDIKKYQDLVDKMKVLVNGLKIEKNETGIKICSLKKENIKNNNFSIDNSGCTFLGYEDLLKFLNSIQLKNGNYIIEYNTGRKDYILGRMLEDGYITFKDYKKAIIDGFNFQFNRYSIKIKYPYFVMYVRDYLEKKYGKEIIEQGGFRIFTTIDSNIQDKAEEIVKKYGVQNKKRFGAQNAALVSIDNKTGGILAMVGGLDYYDVENGGNNNMILAKLQPGSTFKPFVYALAIQNNQIGSKSPIYDVKTTFPGRYTPNNFDGKFKGKMNISTALNNSRNIPAIKMYYLAGGEEKIISFMEKLGVKTLRAFKDNYNKLHPKAHYSYSAPMALGTGLMTPLELVGAYSVFANLGEKKEINPILKIIDRKGNIIEDNTIVINNKKNIVISPSLAYIMNNILSDTSSRPASWNPFLTIGARKIAAKTGTSTKQYRNKYGTKIVAPRNLWTIGYTPQITTVAWAGNTNGKELYLKGNGLEGAGIIMRDFMKFVHKNKKIKDWLKPLKVKTIKVSEISGLLPRKDFPQKFTISSNFLNIPTKYDESLQNVKIDTLCNGKVTSKTPKSAIKEGYFINFHSIDPSKRSWEAGVQGRVKLGKWKEKYGIFGNIITEYKDEPCQRTGKANAILKVALENKDLFIGINRVGVGYKMDRSPLKLEVYYNKILITTVRLSGIRQKAMFINIKIPAHFANTSGTLTFKLIDTQYYSYEKRFNIRVLGTDNIPPKINIENSGVIRVFKGNKIRIIGLIEETGILDKVEYKLNGKLLKRNNDFHINFLLDSSYLDTGNNKFEIVARDKNANEASKTIRIILEE